MSDEQLDELFAKFGDALPDPGEAWGKIFEQAHADSRHAWEMYGVDPDSDLLREPYVRNDGASRIGPNGEVWGGGLPVAQWGTTESANRQGITCADMPIGEGSGIYEAHQSTISAWLSPEVQSAIERRYGPEAAAKWRTILMEAQAPRQKETNYGPIILVLALAIVAFAIYAALAGSL